MILKNKMYDILKWISLIALDAIGVAYKGIAEIWNLPYGTQVMATCSVLSVLIGTLIGISTYNYNKKEK